MRNEINRLLHISASHSLIKGHYTELHYNISLYKLFVITNITAAFIIETSSRTDIEFIFFDFSEDQGMLLCD